MLFVYIGFYNWFYKQVGYRNARCFHCKKEGVAEQFRGLYVMHIWFIPALPLGFYSTWKCAHCDSSPDRPFAFIPTRIKGMTLLFSIFKLCCSIPPLFYTPGGMYQLVAGETVLWIVISLIVAYFYVIDFEEEPEFDEPLKSLQGQNCYYCRGETLEKKKYWFCTRCKLRCY